MKTNIIESYLFFLYEFEKNKSYKGEEDIDKYLKYGVFAFFGGWPGISAYYLWRRRDEVKKELNKPENKGKIKKLKILYKELTNKLKIEKVKFKNKLKKRKKRKKNENK